MIAERTYVWRGQTYHSVTTITGTAPKPALTAWAIRAIVDAAQNRGAK